MDIAVLGGGNGAYAAAADLSEQGHRVRLWRRDAQAFAPVLQSAHIKLKDYKGERAVPIALPTLDVAQAVRGAELVLIPAPATAQTDIARAIAPHLSDGQVVFLPPGTFGSFVMSQLVRGAGNCADISWAETGTLPWLTRKHAPDTVAISVRATRLPTGVYPAKNDAHARAVIGQAFASIEPCEDALSAALMNAGPIIHPPLILLNAAPLQHFAVWDIHNEGTQPAVRAVTSQLDAERMTVREALGYAAPHFPLSDHYENDRWMYGDGHKKLVDSGDWREHIDLFTHRYMVEDTVIGLAFLASVASWAGCNTPIANGLLAIAHAILGDQTPPAPRTLSTLGLTQCAPADLRRILHHGAQKSAMNVVSAAAP